MSVLPMSGACSFQCTFDGETKHPPKHPPKYIEVIFVSLFCIGATVATVIFVLALVGGLRA